MGFIGKDLDQMKKETSSQCGSMPKLQSVLGDGDKYQIDTKAYPIMQQESIYFN